MVISVVMLNSHDSHFSSWLTHWNARNAASAGQVDVGRLSEAAEVDCEDRGRLTHDPHSCQNEVQHPDDADDQIETENQKVRVHEPR